MKQFLVSICLLMSALPVVAQDYLPRDVQGFMNRREVCDQMRRAAPDARERLLKLCMGTDKELVQLKRKYARNSTIMQILNQFEAGIEIAEVPSPNKKAPK
jgi:hypothetical protein